jgi:hypothetical protein|tara:strand:+ start:217 stop:483 length:267 start_codon:yes stop_codon:yes gene_type:complete
MALEKLVKNDKIETILNDVWEFSTVQVRTATIIREDGTDLSRSFHRHVVMPLDDITGEDADVQAICNAVFTQTCKDNYQAFLDSQTNP